MTELDVPGDKSIAHRALILSALAHGVSRIDGLPDGADVASTVSMMRAFGAAIRRDGARAFVDGRGSAGLRASDAPIDCGNSGTTARLGIGLAAALRGSTTFDGDASLRRRPMARVVDPLRALGAHVDYLGEEGRLPLRVSGGALRTGTLRSDVASAQVKSALLIAALAAGVDVVVEEPAPTRDHTERMLRAMAVDVVDVPGRVALRANAGAPAPLDLLIPGDVSSAAFMVAAALLAPAPVLIRGVGLNPTRTGFLDIVERMGGALTVGRVHDSGGEPVGDLTVRPSPLQGTTVRGGEVVRAIDELPLVAILAARSTGTTVVTDAAELRAKESDRIAAVCANLTALGLRAEERPDGFVVHGSDARPFGRAGSFGDHRIAMAFAVLGVAKDARVEVDDLEIAAISYPGFAARLAQVRDASTASLGGAA